MLHINTIAQEVISKETSIYSEDENIEVFEVSLFEFNETIQLVENKLVELEKLQKLHTLLQYQELDDTTTFMIDTYVGLESIGLSQNDFTGLSIEGKNDIALEGILSSIKNGIIAVLEWLMRAIRNFWDSMKSWFSSNNKKHTVKMMDSLEQIFKDKELYVNKEAILHYIPNEEQLNLRVAFYIETIKKFNTYKGFLDNGGEFESQALLESLQRAKNLLDRKNETKIIINPTVGSIMIPPISTIASGTINQYPWLIDDIVGVLAKQKDMNKLEDTFSAENMKKYLELSLQKKIKDIKYGYIDVSDKDQVYAENMKVLCLIFTKTYKAFVGDLSCLKNIGMQIDNTKKK